MNHRFLLRLITNVTISLLTLSCFGIVLWVIDEFLGWDILPDILSLVVRAMVVAGGIIAAVLVVMTVVLSLTLVAEANAARANLPNYSISQRFKRRVRKSIVTMVMAIALLIGGLQVVNHMRGQAAIQAAQIEFDQTQVAMDQSLEEALTLFTPPLLESIDANTLTEDGQLGSLRQLFSSVNVSFPHNPEVALLMPATQAPYQYARIDISTINANDEGRLFLSPQLYTGFPSEQEDQAIEQLFSGNLPVIETPLEGNFLRNTNPSSWGILEQDSQIIAIVFMDTREWDNANRRPLNQKFHHTGPDNLLTN
ncbi:MAG: hypothetical protein AAGA75_02325 [Cyanobacteria bacterium P01_E01_bin.6]